MVESYIEIMFGVFSTSQIAPNRIHYLWVTHSIQENLKIGRKVVIFEHTFCGSEFGVLEGLPKLVVVPKLWGWLEEA